MIPRKLAFLYSPSIEQFSYPQECPFRSERPGKTRLKLVSLGLLGSGDYQEVLAESASREALLRFHRAEYLEELELAESGNLTVNGLHMGLGTPETPVFPGMFANNALACGASLQAADLLLDGKADVAFNLMGGLHHAMENRASGFCYLNDAVLACQHLADRGRRVAYLDVDAHHGDGVQKAFYARKDVLTVSMHESGKTLFPWGGFEHEMGEGEGEGYNVNVPLPEGTYDDAFLMAFDRVVPPIFRAFAPEVIVLELGMDALAGDPLTHLRLTNNAHRDVLQQLLVMEVPLLVLGGGGYNVENTVRGWAMAWETCSQEDSSHDFTMGMGGVMLGCSDWAGGFRDLILSVTEEQRRAVEPQIQATLANLENTVFRLHGLGRPSAVGCNSAAGG